MKNNPDTILNEFFEIEDNIRFDPPPYNVALRQKIIGWYVWNILEHTLYGKEALPVVLEWIIEWGEGLFGPVLADLLDVAVLDQIIHHSGRSRRRRKVGAPAEKPQSKYLNLNVQKDVVRVKEFFSKYEDYPTIKEDLLYQNIQMFGTEMGMCQDEMNLLCLSLRCHHIRSLDSLMDDLLECFGSVSTGIACILGIEKPNAHRMIMPSSLLAKSGVARFKQHASCFVGDHGGALQVLSILHRCLLRPYKSIHEMQGDLLGDTCKTDLSWDDFDHLGQDAEFTKTLIKGAIQQNTTGINILLYGPPGTGKTEFAKALANSIGVNLISIGESDGEGGEATRNDRLGQLSLAQHLLQKSSDTALLLDEMEDLVSSDAFGMFKSGAQNSKTGSVVYLHRVLENTPIPVIWTANHIKSVRQSVLRRFTNAIEFKVPPAPVRARLWSRMLSEAEIDIGDDDIEGLAREIDAPPGVLSNAVVATKCAGGGIEELRHAAIQIVKTVHGGCLVKPKLRQTVRFNQALLNADVNLNALTKSITEFETTAGISLCLYGPPGTGKTAYVRYIAEAMGMDILQKRASDLMSKWVGETEQKISEAFENARSSGRFLVFDEADSLLQDRSGAKRSWEISQVNEMLTWMEVHDLPFACTTNLVGTLDRASLRRFTFKVGFESLTKIQVRLAFTHYFGLKSPFQLDNVGDLTPGDFAVVKTKAQILRVDDKPDQLIQMLKKEADMKFGKTSPIGFVSH